MSKHTPGPWTATKTKGGKGKVVNHNGFSVATMMAGTYNQQEHDAALIAAAPEMLAALRRLFKACGHMPIEATPESAEMMMAGLDAVRAVIKATGEEP